MDVTKTGLEIAAILQDFSLLFPFIFFMTREAILSLFSFGVVLSVYITIFAFIQPYKVTVYNKTDVPLRMVLATYHHFFIMCLLYIL